MTTYTLKSTLREIANAPEFRDGDEENTAFIDEKNIDKIEGLEDWILEGIHEGDGSESGDAISDIKDIHLSIVLEDSISLSFSVGISQCHIDHYDRGDYNHPPEADCHSEDSEEFMDLCVGLDEDDNDATLESFLYKLFQEEFPWDEFWDATKDIDHTEEEPDPDRYRD